MESKMKTTEDKKVQAQRGFHTIFQELYVLMGKDRQAEDGAVIQCAYTKPESFSQNLLKLFSC